MSTRKKLTRVIPILLAVLLVVALGMFENVNYITTYESLAAVFGADLWVRVLAIAVVITDFAALGRVFSPPGESGEDPRIVKWLLVIWFAVSSLDVVLSWFFAALRMEQTVPVAPAAISDLVWIMPVTVALMIWGVQFGILHSLSAIIDKAVYGRVRPRIAPFQMSLGTRHETASKPESH